MLVLPQIIEMKWNNKSKKWFIEKGYKHTKNNDIFYANILDLPLCSHAKIKYICDYCGNHFPIAYGLYNRKRNNGVIKNDCCSKCSGKKLKESNLINFGVESNMHIESVKEKVRKSQVTDSEIVRQAFIDKGYNLVDFNYVNCETHIKYICSKHIDKGIQKLTYTNLKNHNRGCKYCGIEKSANSKKKYNIDIAIKAFDEIGFVLMETNYINSTIEMKCYCKKHPNEIKKKSLNNVRQGHGCWFCHIENNRGENNLFWKGGLTPLHNFLRRKLIKWKKDSMQESEYKCIITGDKNWNVIHHIYPFHKILKETLDEIGIPLKSKMGEYTESEKEFLEEKVLEIHYRYPLGVCLRNDIHDLYHSMYGDENTPEQFEEFKNKYINGELDSLLYKQEVI